jgi:ribonuclease HI
MQFKFWLTHFDDAQLYIKVYTHGACDMNGQPGAIASCAIDFGRNNVFNTYGHDVPGRQTNQRASLYAVLHALEMVEYARNKGYAGPQRVAVFTNSDYPGQVWNRGWKWYKGSVPNEDLVRRLLEFKDKSVEVGDTTNRGLWIIDYRWQIKSKLSSSRGELCTIR